ncbi:MAG: T9SS type A sorting domain-containing protein [Candidatus Hatepunaea meridiana]|nr:T9SS type A sorting domain-containing protein [Candidatus Hatepunaea meridiana]
MQKLHFYHIVSFTLFIIVFPFSLAAQTEVEGNVSGEWTVEGSPYITTDNTIVPEDGSLDVEPGVTIIISPGDSLTIYGGISLQGTEDDSITIISAEHEELRSGILYFEDNEENIRLEYLRINTLYQLYGKRVDIDIFNCTIGNTRVVIWENNGDICEIASNAFDCNMTIMNKRELLFHNNQTLPGSYCSFFAGWVGTCRFNSNNYQGSTEWRLHSTNTFISTDSEIQDSLFLLYTIFGANEVRFSDDNLTALSLDSVDELVIEGTEIREYYRGGRVDDLTFWSVDNVRLTDSEIHGYQRHYNLGDYFIDCDFYNCLTINGAESVTIQNVERGSGVILWDDCEDIIIRNSNLYSLNLWEISDAEIENCSFRDNININDARNVIFRYNDVAKDIIVMNTRRIEIANCYIGTAHPDRIDFRGILRINTCSYGQVSRNLIISPGKGCSISNNEELEFFNNTIISGVFQRGSGIYVSDPPFDIYNNIFYSMNGYSVVEISPRGAETRIDYNLYYGHGGFCNREGLEPGEHDIFDDPHFRHYHNGIEDFRLRADSPCIDAGCEDFGRDPDGTTPDIGAICYDRRVNQPPSVISISRDLTSKRVRYSYEAFSVDDNEGCHINFLDYPDWLRPGPRRDYESASRQISGIIPRDVDRFTFRVQTTDAEGLMDSLDVEVAATDHTFIQGGDISGVISVDESPYMVLGSLIVPIGETLRIEPGCRLEFLVKDSLDHYEDQSGLFVYGTLFCEGTVEDSITITSIRNPHIVNPNRRSFSGIRMDSSNADTNRFAYLHINRTHNIIAEHKNIDIRNCYFEEVSLRIYESYYWVISNRFDSNEDNGSIFASHSNGIISNNLSTGERGGIRSIGGFSHIHNNLLINANRISSGFSDSSHIEHNVLIGSSCISFDNHASPLIENNTVLFNQYGIRCGNGNAVITNNLLSFCQEYGIYWRVTDENEQGTLQYNNVYGNQAGNYGWYQIPIEPDSTNISEDPLLLDIPPYRHHLLTNSPCINTGDPDSPEDPDGTRSDIGAVWFDHDNQAFRLNTLQPDVINANPNEQMRFVVTVDDPEDDRPGFRWSLFRCLEDPIEGGRIFIWDCDIEVGESNTVLFSLSELGIYRLDCIVTDGYNLDTLRWNINITTNSVDERFALIPKELELNRIYPNPFNSAAIIEFCVPKSEKLTLTVFDIQGRAVSVLVNDYIQAGKYKINWQPINFASGVYFIRLSDENKSAFKRIFYFK